MSYDIMFQQALTLHQQGQLDAAEQIYRQILETVPDHPDILNFLGLIAQDKGVHDQAVQLFYKALKKAPKHAALYFNLGVSLNELGKPIEALENLQKAVEFDADNKEVYNKIGLIEHSLNHIEAAQQAFIQALQLDADYSEARANLAVTYLKTDKDKAIRFLTDMSEQYPNEVLAPYFLSTIYLDDNDYINANKYALMAENISSNSADIKLILGLIALKQNKLQDAEVFFSQAVDLDSNNVDALINLANQETNHQDYENAEKHYKRALSLQPRHSDGHLNYANLLYKTNRISEALEEYRAVIIVNPTSAEACNNIGVILKDLEDYQQALGLFFNAYAITPMRTEYSVNIAETLTLLYRQDAETAAAIADTWIAMAPDDVFAKQVSAAFKGEKLEDSKIYSEKLFDNFADNYELVLEKIAYNLPSRIRDLAGDVKGTIVDLGCGSGLVGQALKTSENQIIGIDVSKKMLEAAAKKHVYSKLLKADIVAYCKQNIKALTPSLVIAADVFCYIGNLAPILTTLQGQKLIFSVEVLDEDGDYKLNEAGRYRHTPQYVETLLQQNSFNSFEKFEITLRQENGADVNGLIYVTK